MSSDGFCECGCGQKTSLWPQSNTRLGIVKGQPRRFVQRHFQAIKQLPNYASCHPDRLVKAKGLCASCYNSSIVNSSEKNREAFLARSKNRYRKYVDNTGSEIVAAKLRDRVLKHRYGINADQHNAMMVAQDNKCAICGIEGGDTKSTRLFVDHDHATGKVRELLCSRCNISIGVLEQGAERILSLSKYLQAHDRNNPIWNSLTESIKKGAKARG